jgi:hypothetical protein
MEPKPSWLTRDHPEYDPNRIGAISQSEIMNAVVAAGKVPLAPVFHVRPYDFVIEEQGQFLRVQCKTGRLIRGAVCFRPHRLRAARRETGWERRVTDYRGDIDLFGVYCPETGAVYLVPIKDVAPSRVCSLRVSPAKNNQSKKIRWANNYLVKPLEAQPSIEERLFPSC